MNLVALVPEVVPGAKPRSRGDEPIIVKAWKDGLLKTPLTRG